MTAALRRGRYRPTGDVVTAFTSPWTPNHRQLEALVDDIAGRAGWLIHAIHDSRGESWSADSGWPDRYLLRDGRAVAIEIKVPPDDLTAEQRAWLEGLNELPRTEALVFRSSGDRARDGIVLAELLA